VPSKGKITIGKIAGLEKVRLKFVATGSPRLTRSLTHSLPSKPQEKGKPLQKAVTGDKVAMKLEATNAAESAVLFGRHFDAQDALVSRVTRESIDVLKANFRDEMTKDDWRLVIRLKKVFNID
jgi:hypothetical protein